jgi:hypothetical protein
LSRLDDLLPDQRAALSLLLAQRKRYADVAALLQISERAVYDRAHAALAVLAPRQARELAADRREQIGDYLLGQDADPVDQLRARSFLDSSAPGRAWARAVADELAPLSADLPPVGGGDDPSPNGADPLGAVSHPEQPQRALSASALPVSRKGGAVLLGAIAAIIAGVILAVVLSGGGSHRSKASSAGSSRAGSTATSSTGTAGASKATETKRIALTATDPKSKAFGVAAVLAEGRTYAFYLAAEHLQPSHGFFYAVWLYNSPTSHEALSRSPAVGSDGRLQGGALLPADAGRYHQLILTKEATERPSNPGQIVLRGSFALR